VNACYHAVQNLLSSNLLPKYINIKIQKTAVLPVVFYGCETWSFYPEGRTHTEDAHEDSAQESNRMLMKTA
jgi:hypothetical protein